MRAVVVPRWGGPEVLEPSDVPTPSPAAGEVTISVSFAGVNFADTGTRSGRMAAGPPPVIPGLEVSGEVAEVGEGVTSLAVGDRVAAFVGGGYAEVAVAKAALTWKLPDGFPLEVAASFPVIGVTAFNLLHHAARLQPGESVMIWSAAGGVGSTASQLARVLGAAQVIGVVGSNEKLSTAQRMGCDHVLVSSEGDLTQRVKDLTGGRGVNVILNHLAGSELEADVDRLADYGRLCVYGMASGEPGRIASNALHSRSCSLIGYSTSTHRNTRPHGVWQSGLSVLSLLQADRVEILLGETFPLEEAAEAHRLIESRQSEGKILLRV